MDQEQVLSQLMAPPTPAKVDPAAPRVQLLAKMREIPAAAVRVYLMDLHRASLSAPYKIHESFAEQLTRLTKSVRYKFSRFAIFFSNFFSTSNPENDTRLHTIFSISKAQQDTAARTQLSCGACSPV